MKRAFSIIELLVVMAVIALLVVIAIPAINAMQKSFDSTGSESMISTALATARTLAIKNNHYTGVRFQKAWYKPSSDPAVPPYDNLSKADQYMIFITYNSDKTGLDCGFIAMDGYKPIKLPENICVIDKIVRNYTVSVTPRTCGNPIVETGLSPSDLDDVTANLDPATEPYLEHDNIHIRDTSTFSIVFSPSGKLVTLEVRCRNNDKQSRPALNAASGSDDKVFNSYYDIATGNGQFLQDDYDDFGVGVENSRTNFVIYDRGKFEKMTTSTQKMDYLTGLKAMNINPYTGEIIK
ncbi:MAG: prepilin-type N-terminal cleavage/methylation domain-containing protein [Sedimentisphaerales bacterium]